jgi:hypothetical protein
MHVARVQAGKDGRYGEFHIVEEDLLGYNRENPSAWVGIESDGKKSLWPHILLEHGRPIGHVLH